MVTGAPTANAILTNLPTGGNYQTVTSVAFRKELDRTQQEIRDLLRPETFDGKETWDEVDKLAKDTVAELEKSAGVATTEQPEVKILTASPTGEVEIEISYKLPDTTKVKKDGTPDKRRKPVQGVTTVKKQLTTTAWGNLEDTSAVDATAGLINLKSPKMKLQGTAGKGTTVSRTVEDAGLIANAQARVNKEFNEAFRVATKGDKKHRANVNKLLTEQDKRGKRLSPDEILEFDSKIDQKEIDSYYMTDELFDVMKVFEDDMTWTRGLLVGAEEYNLGTGSLGFGRSFDST